MCCTAAILYSSTGALSKPVFSGFRSFRPTLQLMYLYGRPTKHKTAADFHRKTPLYGSNASLSSTHYVRAENTTQWYFYTLNPTIKDVGCCCTIASTGSAQVRQALKIFSASLDHRKASIVGGVIANINRYNIRSTSKYIGDRRS